MSGKIPLEQLIYMGFANKYGPTTSIITETPAHTSTTESTTTTTATTTTTSNIIQKLQSGIFIHNNPYNYYNPSNNQYLNSFIASTHHQYTPSYSPTTPFETLSTSTTSPTTYKHSTGLQQNIDPNTSLIILCSVLIFLLVGQFIVLIWALRRKTNQVKYFYNYIFLMQLLITHCF